MTRGGNVLAAYLGALGVAALLASGCSSDEAAPATTIVESVTVEATSPPLATDPPTTDPATTDAPTTTLDPAAALAAEVEADLLEAFRLGREASQDPFNAQKEAVALERRLGVIAENLRSTLVDYRERNYAIRPNDDVPASVTVEGEPRFFGAANEVAEVQVCEVNSWIVVEVGAGPNGTDAVVNPDVVATRSTVFMRDVAGIWRFEGGNQLSQWDGAGECPAAS